MKTQIFTDEYIYPYFVSSPNSFRQFSKLVHMYNGNRNIIKKNPQFRDLTYAKFITFSALVCSHLNLGASVTHASSIVCLIFLTLEVSLFINFKVSIQYNCSGNGTSLGNLMPVRRSSVGWSIAGSWLVCFNCLQGKGSYTSSAPIGTLVSNDIISIDIRW